MPLHALLQPAREVGGVDLVADGSLLAQLVEVDVVRDGHMEGRTLEYFILCNRRLRNVQLRRQLARPLLPLLAPRKKRALPLRLPATRNTHSVTPLQQRCLLRRLRLVALGEVGCRQAVLTEGGLDAEHFAGGLVVECFEFVERQLGAMSVGVCLGCFGFKIIAGLPLFGRVERKAELGRGVALPPHHVAVVLGSFGLPLAQGNWLADALHLLLPILRLELPVACVDQSELLLTEERNLTSRRASALSCCSGFLCSCIIEGVPWCRTAWRSPKDLRLRSESGKAYI